MVSRGSLWSLLVIWASKLLLPGLLDGMLYELDIHDHQQKDCWICLQVRQSFRVAASLKYLPDILQDTEESDWQTANIGKTAFQISCFMEKSARYYGPVGWRWMPTVLQKNFRWLSRKWDVSVNSRVLEVTCNALFVYLDIINILLESLMELKNRSLKL